MSSFYILGFPCLWVYMTRPQLWPLIKPHQERNRVLSKQPRAWSLSWTVCPDRGRKTLRWIVSVSWWVSKVGLRPEEVCARPPGEGAAELSLGIAPYPWFSQAHALCLLTWAARPIQSNGVKRKCLPILESKLLSAPSHHCYPKTWVSLSGSSWLCVTHQQCCSYPREVTEVKIPLKPTERSTTDISSMSAGLPGACGINTSLWIL